MKNSKNKKSLILIGAGGHANSCIEIIENNINFKIYGLTDMVKNGKVGKYKILGNDNLRGKIYNQCNSALITVGQIISSKIREKLYDQYKLTGYKFPVIISRSSIVSKNTNLMDGSILMNNSIVNSNVNIGINCIINTGSIIEHDVNIGDFCHISTGSIINGNVIVGNKTFIGSGCIIKNGVTVGNQVVIGAGKYIDKDVKDNATIK